MNVTCMRVKTLKPIFFRRKGRKLALFYVRHTAETVGAFCQLSQPVTARR